MVLGLLDNFGGNVIHLQKVHTEQSWHNPEIELAHKRDLSRVCLRNSTRIICSVYRPVGFQVLFRRNVVYMKSRVLLRVGVVNVGSSHI
jgi:hypothetical protein